MMESVIATLQANWLLIVGSVLVGFVACVGAAKAVKSSVAQKAEASTKSFVARVEAAAAGWHPHAKNPSAPAASVADPPPAAAPIVPSNAGPSAGSGGTDQLKSGVTTMNDKGVVTASDLLSGWHLADYNVEPPLPFVPAKGHADLMYLASVVARLGGNMVYEDVIIGSQEEVNVCKNYPHVNGIQPYIYWTHDGKPKDWAADPAVDADVKAAAEASIAANLAAHTARVAVLPPNARRRA